MFNFKTAILCGLVAPVLSYAVIPSAGPFKAIVGDGNSYAMTVNSTGTFYSVSADNKFDWAAIGTVPTSYAHMFYTGTVMHYVIFGRSGANFTLADAQKVSKKVSGFQFPFSYGDILKITSGNLTGEVNKVPAILTDKGSVLFEKYTSKPKSPTFEQGLLNRGFTNVVGNDYGIMALNSTQTYLFTTKTNYRQLQIPCPSSISNVSLLAASPEYFYMICGTGKSAALYSLDAATSGANWKLNGLFNSADSSSDSGFSYSYAKLTNYGILNGKYKYPGILFVEYSNNHGVHFAEERLDVNPGDAIYTHFATSRNNYHISEIGAILDQSSSNGKKAPVVEGDALFVSPDTNQVLYLEMPQYKFAGTSIWQ